MTLTQTLGKMTERMYQDADSASNTGAHATGANTDRTDEIVDGEFEDVTDRKK